MLRSRYSVTNMATTSTCLREIAVYNVDIRKSSRKRPLSVSLLSRFFLIRVNVESVLGFKVTSGILVVVRQKIIMFLSITISVTMQVIDGIRKHILPKVFKAIPNIIYFYTYQLDAIRRLPGVHSRNVVI